MHNAKAVLATAAVFSSIAIGAQAADLIISPGYEADVVQTYPAADPFTGFYIGGTAGVVMADEDFDDENRATIGGQVGYLQQFGAFVIGAEAQALYLDDFQYALAPTGGLTQDWSLAAKARAGVALDHTLLYGTLGYSITEFGTYGDATLDDDLQGGVTFGLGVEQAFTDAISARLEYQQTRYDDVASIGGVAYDDELVNHAVTLGVNFRF